MMRPKIKELYNTDIGYIHMLHGNKYLGIKEWTFLDEGFYDCRLVSEICSVFYRSGESYSAEALFYLEVQTSKYFHNKTSFLIRFYIGYIHIFEIRINT